MEGKRCKVCGEVINVGERSAFDGVHVKCAKAYCLGLEVGIVPTMAEMAPKKKDYLSRTSRPISNNEVILGESGNPKGSKNVNISIKVSSELYELLLARIEFLKSNQRPSAYIRSLIEKDLEQD